MRDVVDEVLRRGHGVATRRQLLAVLTRGQADDEVRRGHLVSLFRGAYCRPWDADLAPMRERAALHSVGGRAALSHHSALRRWRLADAPDDVHLSVPAERSVRQRPGLVVHRVRDVPSMVRLDGLPTVKPAPALVSAWPLLDAESRRATMLDAVRRRVTTPAALQRGLEAQRRLPGRAELADFVGLLLAGCESELEIWGCLSVFDVPGLRHGVRQKLVQAAGGRYRLDLAYEVERVAVEADGERWHSSAEQRERDRRRDAALASIGWMTLRYSWRRLHRDVPQVRREVLSTLASRRR